MRTTNERRSRPPNAETALRYVFTDEAPNNDVYGPHRRYGVLDTANGGYAMLPNAVLCFGMTLDDALDAWIELRGGRYAESLRG